MAADYEEFPRLRCSAKECVLAGEPAAEHEEGRHPDAQAQTQEHGRRARRRGAAGRRRALRYVVARVRLVLPCRLVLMMLCVSQWRHTRTRCCLRCTRPWRRAGAGAARARGARCCCCPLRAIKPICEYMNTPQTCLWFDTLYFRIANHLLFNFHRTDDVISLIDLI